MDDRINGMPPEALPKYMTIAVALVRYSVGRTTMSALIAANCFATIKVGSRTLIDREAADRFFESLPSAGKSRTSCKRPTAKR